MGLFSKGTHVPVTFHQELHMVASWVSMETGQMLFWCLGVGSSAHQPHPSEVFFR